LRRCGDTSTERTTNSGGIAVCGSSCLCHRAPKRTPGAAQPGWGPKSIYPEEVEAVLATRPAIREVAVIGVPDPLWGEMVVACVTLAIAGTRWQEFDAHCRASTLARSRLSH
jgi:hypothetical protein